MRPQSKHSEPDFVAKVSHQTPHGKRPAGTEVNPHGDETFFMLLPFAL